VPALLAGAGLVTACAVALAARSNSPEDWGIEITSIREAAAGHMIDFRYRVIDADEAAPLFRRGTDAFLLDESTGARLSVFNGAKVGPLRNTNTPQEGRTYFMFFANPGKRVHRGSTTSFVVGEFCADGLRVE
jgi:hypothetical protein